jgi:hypothetical protein
MQPNIVWTEPSCNASEAAILRTARGNQGCGSSSLLDSTISGIYSFAELLDLLRNRREKVGAREAEASRVERIVEGALGT